MGIEKGVLLFFILVIICAFPVYSVCSPTDRVCGCNGLAKRFTLPDGTCSEWGACSVPDIESACADSSDDDCDEKIDCADSDCASFPSCVDSDGDGFASDLDCDDTKASRFPNNVEVCDDLDNDCDSIVDEALFQECGASNVGICRFGNKTCSAGGWGLCAGAIIPVVESCNLFDDDCDGQVDEGCECQAGASRECGISVGVCKKGTQSCVVGKWGDCSGSITPSSEVCGNSLDDDCDGQTDEGCAVAQAQTQTQDSDVATPADTPPANVQGPFPAIPQSASPQAQSLPSPACVDRDGDGYGAACAKGVDCDDADPSISPAAKESCNAKDDDCNSGIDEALFRPCGFNRGVCTAGLQACQGGVWSVCSGKQPVKEICKNDIDDDCDGVVDNGCSLTEKIVGASDASLRRVLDSDLGAGYDFEEYRRYVQDSSRFINVKKSSQIKDGRTFVKLEIIPIQDLFDVTVYEEIPKELAGSTDDIVFNIAPRVVRKDPLVAWHFAEVKERIDLSYEIEGEHESVALKTETAAFAKETLPKKESLIITFLPLAIIPLLGLAAVAVLGLHKKK
jgi:hypothetical protein